MPKSTAFWHETNLLLKGVFETMELEVLLETDDKTTEMIVHAQEVPDIICIKNEYYKVVATHQYTDDAISVICKPAKLLLLLMPSKPTLLNFEKCK